MFVLIQNLMNTGIDEKISAPDATKVRIMNVVFLLSMFFVGIFCFYHILIAIDNFERYAKDIFPLTVANLIFFLVVSYCLYLNYKKKYNLSVLINLTFICCYFIVIIYKTANKELLYSFFGIMLVAFFVINDRKMLFVCVIFIVLSFSFSKIILENKWYKNELQTDFVTVMNTTIGIVLFVIIAYLFKSENQIYIKTIEEQSKKLGEQNHEIQAQNDFIVNTNNLVRESIDYAGRIQKAILPTEKQFKHIFPESFVFYAPKDIVSGDFYWLQEEENYVFWAVGDCTGHGVPGAMMSVLGINALNQIVGENKIFVPAEILANLDKKILQMLEEDGKTTLRDGMDIALMVFDKKTNVLSFASAQRPVWIWQNGELNLFKGTKIPVGSDAHQHKTFETNTIQVQKDDILWAFSDGITDQFSADDTVRFGTPRFKEWIKSHQNLPLEIQKQQWNDFFMSWKGNNMQTDDAVLVGIRF